MATTNNSRTYHYQNGTNETRHLLRRHRHNLLTGICSFSTLIAFILGFFLGKQRQLYQDIPSSPALSSPKQTRNNIDVNIGSSSSSSSNGGNGSGVYRLNEIPLRPTSHAGIMKQQFLEPFQVPRVAGFSIATIHPGQEVELHKHDSMHEFFYVVKGNGIFTINGKEYHVTVGDFVHLAPLDLHGIKVPKVTNNDAYSSNDDGKSKNDWNYDNNYNSSGDLQLLLSGVTTIE